jgi:hypothetical protein
MLRIGAITDAERAGARSSEECVGGKILARRDQIAIGGRVFRFDLPLIFKECDPVPRALERVAASPPFDHRFDVTLGISPQTRERVLIETVAKPRSSGMITVSPGA